MVLNILITTAHRPVFLAVFILLGSFFIDGFAIAQANISKIYSSLLLKKIRVERGQQKNAT